MSGSRSDPQPPASRTAIRDLMVFAILFFVATAAVYFWTIDWVEPIPRDSHRLAVGRDFLNFWMYGRAAFTEDPGRYYDFRLYNSELEALFRLDGMGVNWSYPPNIMLAAAPFGLLGYLPALLLWTALGLVLFLWAARQHISDTRLLFALLCSPAVAFCLVSGQHSLVTAAMMVTALFCLDRRPLLAGILIGLLTLKPQLGLFFPFMLAASGRWRVFMSAAATALAIASVTTALFGAQVWIDYLNVGVPTQSLVLQDPRIVSAPYMPTVFMSVRLAGADYGFAMAIQACFTLAALAIVVWAFRYHRDADPWLLAALFFACSVFGSPYLLSYDLLPLTFAALMLLARGQTERLGLRLVQLVYWLPMIQIALGSAGIPGAALIVPAFAAYLVARLTGGELPATVAARKTVTLS